MGDIFNFIVNEGPGIGVAILATLGGLKVLAKYTPFKGDDKVIEFLEKWAKWGFSKLPGFNKKK